MRQRMVEATPILVNDEGISRRQSLRREVRPRAPPDSSRAWRPSSIRSCQRSTSGAAVIMRAESR